MIVDTYENINFYFGMSKDLNAALMRNKKKVC